MRINFVYALKLKIIHIFSFKYTQTHNIKVFQWIVWEVQDQTNN